MTPKIDRARASLADSDTQRQTADRDDEPRRTDGGGLTAGVARVDITPDTGRSFQGYVRPDMRAEGVGIRLFARALVLDDGDQKVALVSADILCGFDKEQVLDRVRSLGFSRETVLYAGTHTHAGTEIGEWTAAQVARAIEAADQNREPALAGWATTTVSGVNRNRSLEAHLANHGLDLYPGTGSLELDPCGPDHPRETTLRLLRVERPDGTPIAAWSQFPVHPTAFSPHNTVYSADLAGAAVRQFADRFDGEGPTTLFSNGTEGDLIPVYEAYNQYAVAELLGERLADGLAEAWERAGDALSETLPLAARGRTVTYDGQEVEPGARVGSRALFGLPFLGGAENGPSFFYGLGLEGTRRPSLLSDRVHGRKIPVAPAPWDPEVELQALRIGDRVLLSIPGEPTVQMGRRCRDAVADAVPEGVSDVAIVGLANEYNGYFTTPEEYDQQHYEGGHTTFGKHSEALVRTTYVDIAAGLDGAGAADTNEPASDSESSTEMSVGPRVDPPAGRPSVGTLEKGPAESVERLSTVTVEWSGGPEGRDRPLGDPFVRVEREDGDETVATDLGLGFVWTVEDGAYTARYEIPRALPTGTYRLRVTGAGYELPTDTFAVEPATDLRLRGVERVRENGEALLVVHAQYPPPDPDRHLRHRPVQPEGGTVTFEVDGTERTAAWDEERAAWTVEANGVETGETVTVPAGGLEDGDGNRSGGPVTLTVGDIDEVTWPPHMGPGNGRPPGPFGFGTWPC
jgi:neutral ceramidase